MRRRVPPCRQVANDTLVEEKKRKYDGHTERTRTAAKAAKR